MGNVENTSVKFVMLMELSGNCYLEVSGCIFLFSVSSGRKAWKGFLDKNLVIQHVALSTRWCFSEGRSTGAAVTCDVSGLEPPVCRCPRHRAARGPVDLSSLQHRGPGGRRGSVTVGTAAVLRDL